MAGYRLLSPRLESERGNLSFSMDMSGKIYRSLYDHIIMPIYPNVTMPIEQKKKELHAGKSKPRILLHCPDITLKGRNQADFQRALVKNIKYKLARIGCSWGIGDSRGRAIVNIPEQSQVQAQMQNALHILQQTPGISSLAITRWLPASVCLASGQVDWELLSQEMVSLASEHYMEDASFAIQVNRADKSIPTTSQELATRLGEAIRQYSEWQRVDLKKPDKKFYIDIYPDGFYLCGDKLKGVGGLPVGTGGRVLALLSGGIDSPVAAYMLAKRGCDVDFFHLSASHMQQRELENSVIVRLACQLSRFTQHSRLYVVPYTYFDLALTGQQTGFELVLFRRFMMRAAALLAEKVHAQALVNGDSLGQVASQTLENLVSSSRPVCIPVLRPLIGTNKEEIITEARRIDTYEISIQPYKDCCALISRHPKTRSKHEQLNDLEISLFGDYEKMIEDTFGDMVCLEFRCGELVDINGVR